jgi:hypothetical protein
MVVVITSSSIDQTGNWLLLDYGFLLILIWPFFHNNNVGSRQHFNGIGIISRWHSAAVPPFAQKNGATGSMECGTPSASTAAGWPFHMMLDSPCPTTLKIG